MKKEIIIVMLFIVFLQGACAQGLFYRSDANSDEKIDISDSISILNYLFLGSQQPPCLDAADVNDDGKIDISDAIFLMNGLFLGSDISQAYPNGFMLLTPDFTPDRLGCAAPRYAQETLAAPQEFISISTSEELYSFLSQVQYTPGDGAELILTKISEAENTLTEGNTIQIGIASSAPQEYPLTIVQDTNLKHLVLLQTQGEYCSEETPLKISKKKSVTTSPPVPPTPPTPPVSSPTGCCEYKESNTQYCKKASSKDDCPGEITTTKKNIHYSPTQVCTGKDGKTPQDNKPILGICKGELTGCCSVSCDPNVHTGTPPLPSWGYDCLMVSEGECNCDGKDVIDLCKQFGQKYICGATGWSSVAECKPINAEERQKKTWMDPVYYKKSCKTELGGICSHITLSYSLLKLKMLEEDFALNKKSDPLLPEVTRTWNSERFRDMQGLSGNARSGLNYVEQKSVYEKYGLVCPDHEKQIKNPIFPSDPGDGHLKACSDIDKELKKGKDCSIVYHDRFGKTGHIAHIISTKSAANSCEITTATTSIQNGGHAMGVDVPFFPSGNEAWIIGPKGLQIKSLLSNFEYDNEFSNADAKIFYYCCGTGGGDTPQ